MGQKHSQKEYTFIKDPIHGYIRVSETERTVVDTRPVQRLRRLRQLAGSEFVYPAANHTRFEHVLGAMHLAGALSEVLPTQLDAHDQEQIRLAALLHDIGHGPFSHVFEPLMVRHFKKTHEDFVPWLVNETEVADRLDQAVAVSILTRWTLSFETPSTREPVTARWTFTDSSILWM